MNPIEYKTYIDKLCTMSNNYYLYDEQYIKNKFNINSYDNFRKFFKKYHNEKLIFNSEKAEFFFIKVMNLDTNYMAKKYANCQAQAIIDFFIKRNNCYFNECEEFNKSKISKLHSVDCKCKIKVKSVVNLSINALIFILMEHNASFNDINPSINIITNTFTFNKNNKCTEEQLNQNSQIIKLYNNQSNKKIIECINKIEIAKNNLGLCNSETIYQLTETKPIINVLDTITQIESINIPCKNDDMVNTLSVVNNNCYEINNNVSHELINTKKYDEQLISESIDLNETDDFVSQTNNSINNTIENAKNNYNLLDSERLTNLAQYALNNINNKNINNIKKIDDNKNSDKEQFNIENIKSESSDNSKDSTNSCVSVDKINQDKRTNQNELINSSNNLSSSSNLSNTLNLVNANNEKKIKSDDSTNSISSNNSNRFGNVVVRENKVKIEKKQPVDLNNSSDILVSYNDNDYTNKKYILTAVISKEKTNNKKNLCTNTDKFINLQKDNPLSKISENIPANIIINNEKYRILLNDQAELNNIKFILDELKNQGVDAVFKKDI